MNYPLKKMKEDIENMPKIHQIEILRILHHSPEVTLNENKSGVFINLSQVPESVIEKIRKYVLYVSKQENQLDEVEKEKAKYKNHYFSG